LTEEKICPIISFPIKKYCGTITEQIEIVKVLCLREKCMAWRMSELETNEGKAYGRIAKVNGYCKLIEGAHR